MATGTTTPVLTLNSGTTANKIVKLNSSAQLPAVSGALLTSIPLTTAVSGVLPAANGGILVSTITIAGASTTTQIGSMCLDRTVGFSSDLNQAALTFNVALGTFPAHFIFTDVWSREATTFAAPVDSALTVSVGSAAHPDYLLPAVGLMQATSTVAGSAPSVPALTDSSIAIVAAFTVTVGGQNLSTYTAGSWDVRVCGHLGI